MKGQQYVYWLIPAVLIVVGTIQLFQVQDGLTRWKGGGFGMYSEHHFSDFEVWISKTSPLEERGHSKEIKSLLWNLKLKPNRKNAIILLERMNIQKDTTLIQVWKPKLEVPDLRYRRELIYETIYIKNQGSKK